MTFLKPITEKQKGYPITRTEGMGFSTQLTMSVQVSQYSMMHPSCLIDVC